MLGICVFNSAICNKASSRGFDAAVEEVWVQLQLHDICKNQLHCGCSLHSTDTRGIYTRYCTVLSEHIYFSFLVLMSVILSPDDQNQTYELYAVVDHFGDLRSGHYTAKIKDDERWYTFDDSKVSLVRLITKSSIGQSYILQCKKTPDSSHYVWLFFSPTVWLSAIPGGHLGDVSFSPFISCLP